MHSVVMRNSGGEVLEIFAPHAPQIFMQNTHVLYHLLDAFLCSLSLCTTAAFYRQINDLQFERVMC